ncbi:Hypothetical protein CINCED_3A018276 [Cinara cedri]|uniref:Uncharacterized protein n=1 Tax=Cinara cedri TaxID=506608 RepID=A0A5E4MJV5_9HEMI|nr:Hypothetical protein CINCED_3A018276 [Cinara cedri]
MRLAFFKESADKKFEQIYEPHRCVQTVVARGIVISNTSLINLFKDADEYGVFYITTRKLNQSVLENQFSFLKGMAGNTEDRVEESFLDSFECLTGEVMKNSDLLPNTSCERPEIYCDQDEVETDLGTTRVQIPNNSFDLLK